MATVIRDWARTPIAPVKGELSGVHAVELGASVVRELVDRNRLFSYRNPIGVVIGCATPIGEQSMNFASAVSAASGIGPRASSMTVDAGPASGMSAFELGASLVDSGRFETVIVGAVSAVSRVPSGSVAGLGVGRPYGPKLLSAYMEFGGLKTPAEELEELAKGFDIGRGEVDRYVAQTHRRTADHLKNYPSRIVGVDVGRGRIVDFDSVVRPTSTQDLKPMFVADGLLNAASYPEPCDGGVFFVLERNPGSERSAVQVVGTASHDMLGQALGGFDVQVSAELAAPADLGVVDSTAVHEDSAITPLAFLEQRKLDADDAEAFDVNECGGALAWGDVSGAGGLIELQMLLDRYASQPGGFLIASVLAGSANHHSAIVVKRES